MKKFFFEAEVNGQKEVVQLSELFGGANYFVYINNFFIMSIIQRDGDWVMLCNNESWLTTDELTIFKKYMGPGK